MNKVFTILFHYLLPFFRQLHNFIFPKLIFWTKNCFKCLLQSSSELKFFPLREFVKTKTNGNLKVQCLLNMADESELPSQAAAVLPGDQICVILVLFWCLVLFFTMHSLLTDSGHYIHNTLFGWRLAFGVVGGGSLHLPHVLFCSTLLYNIHFSSSVTNRFKNGTFSHAEIWSRSSFFFWFGMQTSKWQAGANNIQCWFGYSLYDGYFLHWITLIVLS